MSPSAERRPADGVPGERLAVVAESLYLANLLLAPGLAFAVLLWLYVTRRRTAAPLGLAHLDQTLSASLWAGILLIGANAAILLVGGYEGPNVWTLVIVWFTVFHSSLVLLGIIGLARAMAGQCWRYPLVGRPLPAGCSRG